MWHYFIDQFSHHLFYYAPKWLSKYSSIGISSLNKSDNILKQTLHISIFRVNTPRKQGGLGNMKIPLIADKTMEISKKYGVLKEDDGVAFR